MIRDDQFRWNWWVCIAVAMGTISAVMGTLLVKLSMQNFSTTIYFKN